MSRRHAAVQRTISPDTKYNSVSIAKFINHLMLDGKKNLAEKNSLWCS
jgi:small subunit ribosomal protein S7